MILGYDFIVVNIRRAHRKQSSSDGRAGG